MPTAGSRPTTVPSPRSPSRSVSSRARLLGLAVVGSLLAVPAARAAPGPASAPAAAGGKKAGGGKAGKAGKKGKRRIALEDEFLVEGHLEKPSAFYVLRRSSIDYDWARVDAKFIPLVLESVQDPLF